MIKALCLSNQQLIDLLKNEVQPAVGCTEPGAVVYAASLASEKCRGEIKSIEVLLSPGVLKNAYSVGIPGTGEKGLELAGAIGALLKSPAFGLELLHNLSPDTVQEAKKMAEANVISIDYDCDEFGVFVQVTVTTDQDTCRVVLKGGHTNLQLIELNGRNVFEGDLEDTGKAKVSLRECRLNDLIEQAATLELSETRFLLNAYEQNKKVADLGLNSKYGAGIGFGLSGLFDKGILERDVVNEVKAAVAAASDVRMAGVDFPVYTSFGSGNQGILCSLAIGFLGEKLEVSEERLGAALAIGHLVNGYVKEHIGKISVLCGCSVSAGLGVAAAASWLINSDADHTKAMDNLLGNITGIICDGAKGSCALKLATSAGEALISAFLGAEGISINTCEGIIERDIHHTIANLGLVTHKGMPNLDTVMLDLVLNRDCSN
jgi:L-cysteine desulfidase